MRPRLPIVLLLALSFVAAGCDDHKLNTGTHPAAVRTLHVYRSESFDGWVLDSAAAYASYQTHAAVMEPLVRFAADGIHVEPGLAESWSYDAATYTWTFLLRANAKFSNGAPVSSRDVVFSYGIWSKGVNFGRSFDRISEVVAVDARTIRFVMKHADSTLPATLSGSIAGIMPANFGGLTKDQYYAAPVGAGPYTVKQWSGGGRIVLSRNHHYYAAGRPYFDEVVIDVVPDDNELAILFESGQADIVEYVSAIMAGQYRRSALVVNPTSQVSHLSLNVRAPPFNDLNVRRAVALALDYNAIVNGPFKGVARFPTGLLTPNIANWAPPSTHYYATDLTAARALLKSSRAGVQHPLELIYDAAIGADGLVAQIVSANLAQLGIDVKLTGLETLAFLDRAYSLGADMIVWSYGAVSPDISDPLGWIDGTEYLFTGYDRSRFDEQNRIYLSTTSAAQKRSAVVAIQDEALEQAAAIALAEYSTIHAVSATLSGFAAAPWGLYYYDTIRRSGDR
jgi:peptide/nickel transport system substrate-binding protein